VYPYLYWAHIASFEPANLVELVIDLGFHVRVRRMVAAPEGVDKEDILYCWHRALVIPDDQGGEDIRFLHGAQGEPHLPPPGEGPPELWRYPARITHIVDADTVDAELHIGFGIIIKHRLRLAGIQVAEYGEEARLGFMTVFHRLKRNRFYAHVVSSRHGKWRRWLADIYFPDSDRSLNDELVDRGYAHYWDGRSPKTPGFSRMIMEVADQTRGRLSDLAATEGIAPGQVAGRIVSDYLDSSATGDRD